MKQFANSISRTLRKQTLLEWVVMGRFSPS